MKKLSPQGVKILKMFHLFFAILWIGGGLALVILFFSVNPANGDELYMKSRIIQIIDDFLIIPGAMASLLIGIIYGIWTNWGFFKHKWLIVKWIMTILQILFGTFVLGPWVNENVEIASALRDAAMDDATLLHNVKMSQIWGTVQVAILVITFIVVSVQKPWRPKKKA
ncbi:putative membrane protein [Dysgonomonas sp. PFB1-18]|uniref:DUF2269 family protein n=1 Tax=unclassified Dysgonomonas TaxID=2630389 RepID=UPI0024752785|nr:MULTISPECIES: DUF2269 family protein [unclassified Dysgonomonas]MDH6310455.1 putative membrane protein [Dysgonomonas sp. PF1-14]MDH6340766.1 putative membrane protein [Dysgonomonas sp. PF1-16]MDH6382386.1 putative membrane protein [Dysgonomonas sp. PFB1-18]MDH6399713.1 putative membrane protein [Dysgonomonas sp. PF1-23]